MSKQKRLIIQFFLCLFLGTLGAHRFANKQRISASSMLILSFIPFGLTITALWAFVDLIIIITKLCARDKKPQIKNTNSLTGRKYLTWLRNLNLEEGKQQQKSGTPEQATNCFMKILYLDLLDDFEMAFTDACLNNDIDIDDNGKFILPPDKKKEITKLAIQEFNKKNVFLAPAIYQWAFQEDLSLEKFEEIFKFNANSINESLKNKVPITPGEAWQKVLEYRESLEKAQ